MAVQRYLVYCAFAVALATVGFAGESWESASMRAVMKVYDECSKYEKFSPCLKKKALTFFNRLNRMDKLALTDELIVVKSPDATQNETVTTDEQLENSLPKNLEERDAVLDTLLYDKVSSFIESRTIRFTLPKLSMNELGLDEGRGKKMKNMFGGMMMGMAGKMATLIPIAIAGLYVLAGKALITAKVALLIIGIIILKKIIAAKNQGGGGGGHGGGGGGGWQGAWQSGNDWEKRSLGDPQKIAYSAYSPQ